MEGGNEGCILSPGVTTRIFLWGYIRHIVPYISPVPALTLEVGGPVLFLAYRSTLIRYQGVPGVSFNSITNSSPVA